MSVGIGYDSHRLEGGRRLVLGGVEIPGAARGLTGWSDADVLTHAIIDALLGAAGLGDIGQHFPDSDQRWRNADSIELLRTVRGMLPAPPLHVDATLLCEAPKLGEYRDPMRGRGEGIAALAIARLADG
jgi:2-C-methyl-D-erythritol 2,4-cyclodiphosphate synthase